MRLLAPIRRGTFLVLLGAALVSVALTVGVAVRAPAPMAVSAPEPVGPSRPAPSGSTTPGDSPTGTTQPADDAGQPDGGEPDGRDQPDGGDQPGVSQSGAPDSPGTSSRPQPPAGQAAKFQAVAGPACPVDARRDVRISGGWQVVPGDSWTGDGCGDRFLYSAPDDTNYLQWRFTLDGPARCRVAVFVPDSPLSSDNVWYGIGDRPDNADYRIGGFTVDQKANRGRWVEGASVPVGDGMLMVNVDGDQNRTGVTAAPLRVSC